MLPIVTVHGGRTICCHYERSEAISCSTLWDCFVVPLFAMTNNQLRERLPVISYAKKPCLFTLKPNYSLPVALV
jgi:hypothetical protein